MNSHNISVSNSHSETLREVEQTLKLIATISAPQGLEERVKAGIRSAHRSHGLLAFPSLPSPTENWFRAAAAAAIVFVVIGGGWGIYSRVPAAGPTAVAPQMRPSNGFSNAGAVRVPQTLQAPVVSEPALVQSVPAESSKQPDKAAPHTQNSKKLKAAGKKAQLQQPAPTAR